mgnify:CR=1 FL=1
MPPKSSKKKLKSLETQNKLLEAEIAKLQALNKRATSPSEVLKVASAAKKTSAKKQKKTIKTSSSDESEEQDQLKAYKDSITKTIHKEIFPTMKFVKGTGTMKKMCSHILYYGLDTFGKMREHERVDWRERFGPYAATQLNALRNNINTAIKKEFKALYFRNNGHIGNVERWEACLTRELDISLPQDRLDYEFYYGTIMDKATGYPDHWNQAHRGYMTIYKGKPPEHCKLVAPACPEDKDRDFYVTPETEADAMLIIKGGFDKWEAQFETARTYPGYQQKIYHKAVDQAKIMASDAIKQELYLAQHPGVTAETLPAGWLASMQMTWEDNQNFVSLNGICPFFFVRLALF